MLGFNKKPTWWNTYYSWTDAVKRASLLIALEFGKVSDPSTTDVFDINYALKNYDWQNDTLVTLLGTLNDPVTANVVTSPVDPAKDFVFGDWGPVEALWRRTSEGKIASALSFLRTRPLIALNKYFRTLRRQIKNVNGYNNPQEIDAIALKLTSWKNTKLTGTSITGKIIESVRILESGSGYTSTPTVKVTDNFGVDGAVEVIVDSGAVVELELQSGSDYYNRPTRD